MFGFVLLRNKVLRNKRRVVKTTKRRPMKEWRAKNAMHLRGKCDEQDSQAARDERSAAKSLCAAGEAQFAVAKSCKLFSSLNLNASLKSSSSCDLVERSDKNADANTNTNTYTKQDAAKESQLEQAFFERSSRDLSSVLRANLNSEAQIGNSIRSSSANSNSQSQELDAAKFDARFCNPQFKFREASDAQTAKLRAQDESKPNNSQTEAKLQQQTRICQSQLRAESCANEDRDAKFALQVDASCEPSRASQVSSAHKTDASLADSKSNAANPKSRLQASAELSGERSTTEAGPRNESQDDATSATRASTQGRLSKQAAIGQTLDKCVACASPAASESCDLSASCSSKLQTQSAATILNCQLAASCKSSRHEEVASSSAQFADDRNNSDNNLRSSSGKISHGKQGKRAANGSNCPASSERTTRVRINSTGQHIEDPNWMLVLQSAVGGQLSEQRAAVAQQGAACKKDSSAKGATTSSLVKSLGARMKLASSLSLSPQAKQPLISVPLPPTPTKPPVSILKQSSSPVPSAAPSTNPPRQLQRPASACAALSVDSQAPSSGFKFYKRKQKAPLQQLAAVASDTQLEVVQHPQPPLQHLVSTKEGSSWRHANSLVAGSSLQAGAQKSNSRSKFSRVVFEAMQRKRGSTSSDATRLLTVSAEPGFGAAATQASHARQNVDSANGRKLRSNSATPLTQTQHTKQQVIVSLGSFSRGSRLASGTTSAAATPSLMSQLIGNEAGNTDACADSGGFRSARSIKLQQMNNQVLQQMRRQSNEPDGGIAAAAAAAAARVQSSRASPSLDSNASRKKDWRRLTGKLALINNATKRVDRSAKPPQAGGASGLQAANRKCEEQPTSGSSPIVVCMDDLMKIFNDASASANDLSVSAPSQVSGQSSSSRPQSTDSEVRAGSAASSREDATCAHPTLAQNDGGKRAADLSAIVRKTSKVASFQQKLRKIYLKQKARRESQGDEQRPLASECCRGDASEPCKLAHDKKEPAKGGVPATSQAKSAAEEKPTVIEEADLIGDAIEIFLLSLQTNNESQQQQASKQTKHQPTHFSNEDGKQNSKLISIANSPSDNSKSDV